MWHCFMRYHTEKKTSCLVQMSQPNLAQESVVGSYIYYPLRELPPQFLLLLFGLWQLSKPSKQRLLLTIGFLLFSCCGNLWSAEN